MKKKKMKEVVGYGVGLATPKPAKVVGSITSFFIIFFFHLTMI
jgi:hypothetical protein